MFLTEKFVKYLIRVHFLKHCGNGHSFSHAQGHLGDNNSVEARILENNRKLKELYEEISKNSLIPEVLRKGNPVNEIASNALHLLQTECTEWKTEISAADKSWNNEKDSAKAELQEKTEVLKCYITEQLSCQKDFQSQNFQKWKEIQALTISLENLKTELVEIKKYVQTIVCKKKRYRKNRRMRPRVPT